MYLRGCNGAEAPEVRGNVCGNEGYWQEPRSLGWCLVLLETIVHLSGVGCGCECPIAVNEAACPAQIWLVLVEHDRECRSNVRWSMRTCFMAHELFGRVLYEILYAARLSEVSPSVGMDRDAEGLLTRCQETREVA